MVFNENIRRFQYQDTGHLWLDQALHSIVINFAHSIEMNELIILTLNLVVEISAFRMSGSYFVLDEEPENT